MNLNQLASHITSLESLSSSNLEDTKLLVEKFPYSSTAHILRLKTLANANHIDFEDELKTASAHVGDREHLFHLINDEKSVKPEVLETTTEVEIIEVKETVDIEEKQVETQPDPTVEKIKDEIEEPQHLLKESDAQPIKEEDTLVEEEEELSTLDEEILSHVVSSAFEKAADQLIPEKEIIEEEESKIEAVKTEEEEEEEEEEAELKTKIETTSTTAIDTSNLSFVEWLQLKQGRESAPPASAFSEIEETKAEEEPIVEEKSTEVKSEKQMSKKEINALLDRFIEEQPSISKPQKEFFNPTENAKSSLEESGEIVSETLAKIHVMQGNYKKAISAYKQLSLLYPEKKTFFASQIEKIKDKII